MEKKEIPNNEDCRIALTTEECKEEDEWYINNGCSSHMTRDQDKFISLKRKGGNVAFGDDSSAKILGKGVVELGRKNLKSKNVLLVEDLKHNLLNVSKMCDQGYTLMGSSPKEEVISFPLNLREKPHHFPLMSKGERNQEHEDRGSMGVSINDKGGDCWKIGCFH
jgi:hypothetical protein